jgi:GTPase involved in cell partitioning and DNA repair
MENDCRQLQAEVQCLKEMVMENEHLIEATKCDIQEDLRANNIKKYQFEKASEVIVTPRVTETLINVISK